MLKFVVVALFGVAAVCNAALIGGSLVGGFSDADPKDDDVVGVLSFAEARLNAMSNDMYSSRVSKVVKVQRQIVNGINYKIQFEFARTQCNKMSMISLESCPPSGRVQVCSVEVYQSFNGDRSMNKFDCKPRDKMERRAGAISGPVSDAEIKNYFDDATRALSLVNAKLDKPRVTEVRTQVVAGLLLYVKVQGMSGDEPTICDMTIWKRPWLAEPEDFMVQESKCRPVQEVASRRDLGEFKAGGISDVDDKDLPIVQTLLTGFLEQSNQFSQSQIEIVSATQQVVAGMKYVIKFKSTQPSGVEKMCKVTLLSQPWMPNPTQVLGGISC